MTVSVKKIGADEPRADRSPRASSRSAGGLLLHPRRAAGHSPTRAGRRAEARRPASRCRRRCAAAEASAAAVPRRRTVLAASTSSGRRASTGSRPSRRSGTSSPPTATQMMAEPVKGQDQVHRLRLPRLHAGLRRAARPGDGARPADRSRGRRHVVVHFRNKLRAPVTMHPHGIFYANEMDGAYKGKLHRPRRLRPAQPHLHLRLGARPKGPKGTWLYHDHGPMDPLPVFKGLFGPLVIRAPGEARPNREFFLAFHTWDPVDHRPQAASSTASTAGLRRQHADPAKRRSASASPSTSTASTTSSTPSTCTATAGPNADGTDRSTTRPSARPTPSGSNSPRTTRAAGSTTATSSAPAQGMNGWYVV